MPKHFFSFRKILDGQPQPIHIDIVVDAPSRKLARPIAMRQMKQIQDSVEFYCEERDEPAPAFLFVGVN